MTNLLARLFIKDYKNTDNYKVREQYGKLAGIAGITTNLLLFVMKITVGAIFNSIAIIADSINNLSDSASSIVTVVGFKLSGKPADEKHPYGHARIEYIAGMIVSFIILVLGLQLGKSSFDKIVTGRNGIHLRNGRNFGCLYFNQSMAMFILSKNCKNNCIIHTKGNIS